MQFGVQNFLSSFQFEVKKTILDAIHTFSVHNLYYRNSKLDI